VSYFLGVNSREIRLASRPSGPPTPENFQLAEVEVPDPVDGQAVVRNLFVSVDPYMRGRMNDVKSYVPPFALGVALQGGAVGQVVSSRAPGFAEGDLVLSMYGWREAYVASGRELTKLDPSVTPWSAYLGILGVTGMTAWVGLNLVDTKAGDKVFVSAAAGGTGSVAGQLAKLRGCWVVGSAGSDEKVETIKRDFGFDEAFNYRGGKVTEKLKAAAPQGIDVYFDNVGGDHLEAALAALRPFGRIIACGAISQYNDATPAPGPSNLSLVIGKRLTMRGFIVTDSQAERPRFLAEIMPHVASGKLEVRETVVTGVENAPRAFLDLLAGKNVGKMIVKVGG
jgi:NADPH-dependent curcumin reductase CurA